MQAFRGYADNDPCDGQITADELIEYVRSNVRRYARERSLTQTPTARGDYEPEMVLGVATECLNAGDKAPSMFGTAVIETNLDDVDVYIDGKLIGRISKAKPLVVPSLSSGLHEFQGVKAGYEPERKQVMISPGQESAVTLRIRYVRQVKPPALELNEQGEKLLFTRRSSMSLMNLVPTERKQSDADLQRAAGFFEKALAVDPNYTVAAYHLGQVHQLLLNHEESVKYFQRAIAIDPTHVDSRIECAAVLIENGDPDEAIRQLTEVIRLEANNDEAFSMLARAYWDKGAWPQSIEVADQGDSTRVVERAGTPLARRCHPPARRRGEEQGAPGRALHRCARRLPRVSEPHQLLIRARGEARVSLHRLRHRQPPARRSAGRVRQPARLGVSRVVSLRAESRQSAQSPRVLPACTQARAERSDRLLPARQRQPRHLQRPPDVRLPDRRARQLRADARDQRRSRRVEERQELRRADRRHPAGARLPPLGGSHVHSVRHGRDFPVAATSVSYTPRAKMSLMSV